MLSRKSVVAATASLLTIVTVITATASEWKPSVKPATSVKQAVFLPPLIAPVFEATEAGFEPPLLVPSDEEAPPGKAPVDALENAPVGDSEPVFETEDGAATIAASDRDSPSFDVPPAEESADSPKAATDGAEEKSANPDEEPEEKLLGISTPDEPEDQGRSKLWNESSMDWVLRGGSDGIGFFSLTGDAPSWEFDLNSDEEGLKVDFGSAVHFVSGPSRSDLPPRLFDIFWNTRFTAETDYGIGIDANFKLGLFTDFEDSVREGWRFPGRVLGYADLWHNSTEVARVVAGIEYLDLEQTEILPAGGIIFEPNPDTKIDLYFPRPQARFRIDQDDIDDHWLYFRGEYHGSAWAIERTAGNADVVSLTEFRATVGLETISNDKDESTSFAEFGYIFNRDLEYRSGLGNFQPADTVVFRMGSRY